MEDYEGHSISNQRTFEEVSLDAESSWNVDIMPANHENFQKGCPQLSEVKICRKDGNAFCDSLPSDSRMVHAYIKSRDVSAINVDKCAATCPKI